MNRWRREFRAWAERENMAAWAMPKKPEDWRVAQAASRMFDHIARTPEFQQRWRDAVVKDVMENYPQTPLIAGGLASFLASPSQRDAP